MAKKIQSELKEQRDQFMVVLEEIRCQNKVFGEALGIFREEFHDFKKEVKEEFADVRGEMRSNFKTVFDYLSRIDDEIQSMKAELKELRAIYVDKKYDTKFSEFEIRLKKIELELSTRRVVSR